MPDDLAAPSRRYPPPRASVPPIFHITFPETRIPRVSSNATLSHAETHVQPQPKSRCTLSSYPVMCLSRDCRHLGEMLFRRGKAAMLAALDIDRRLSLPCPLAGRTRGGLGRITEYCGIQAGE